MSSPNKKDAASLMEENDQKWERLKELHARINEEKPQQSLMKSLQAELKLQHQSETVKECDFLLRTLLENNDEDEDIISSVDHDMVLRYRGLISANKVLEQTLQTESERLEELRTLQWEQEQILKNLKSMNQMATTIDTSAREEKDPSPVTGASTEKRDPDEDLRYVCQLVEEKIRSTNNNDGDNSLWSLYDLIKALVNKHGRKMPYICTASNPVNPAHVTLLRRHYLIETTSQGQKTDTLIKLIDH